MKFTTIEAMLAENVAAPRFRTVLFAAFGGLAMCLAMAGIYGVVAYTVGQRGGEGVSRFQHANSERRRRHLRNRAEEFAFAQLQPRAVQRETGNWSACVSSDVCGGDEVGCLVYSRETGGPYFAQNDIFGGYRQTIKLRMRPGP